MWRKSVGRVGAVPRAGAVRRGDRCQTTSAEGGVLIESVSESRFQGPAFPPCGRAFATQIKGLMSYTIPKVDVQVSATIQSLPGRESGREPGRAERNGGANMGRPLGAGQQRDREPHCTADALRRPDQPGRLPHRETSAIRTQPDAGGPRHLQRDELECSTAIPSDVHGPTWLRPTSVMDAGFAG